MSSTESSRTFSSLARDLAARRVTSRELVEECLARITAQAGEGPRTFIKIFAEQARAAADAVDVARARGNDVGTCAGIPISVKDLFDVAGQVTTAGSVVLRNEPVAKRDAPIVQRLREAGLVILGSTNMTEFAFSGLGVNPHFGTPRNPWDRSADRIPGGSSSGAAVSVTDGMAFAAIGTDTGGSCRIPAAFCGIVGFKPTARRVPREGAYPLSSSLDSIGPLACSVSCCATLDAIMAGETQTPLAALSLAGLRMAVPQSYVLEEMAPEVSAAFDRALHVLAARGVRMIEIPFVELSELPGLYRHGGLAAAEAFAWHRERIATSASQYDPRVLVRILRGREQSPDDYRDLLRRREEFITRVAPTLAAYDALLMPTVPILAPRIEELREDDEYTRINALALRNSSAVNFMDGCAISIPCHEPGTAPVGLTLFSGAGRDRQLLSIAAAAERSLVHA